MEHSHPPSNWSEFIAIKPQWVQEIINNSTYDDIPSVMARLQHTDRVLAVSDGSVNGFLMSYGWVISSLDGNNIAKGYGPCHGRPSSLRAEAHGMLAASIFLGMLQEFSNWSFTPLQVDFLADNSSLILRESNHLNYQEPYVNCTLDPEFDLKEQIFLTTKV